MNVLDDSSIDIVDLCISVKYEMFYLIHSTVPAYRGC